MPFIMSKVNVTVKPEQELLIKSRFGYKNFSVAVTEIFFDRSALK